MLTYEKAKNLYLNNDKFKDYVDNYTINRFITKTDENVEKALKHNIVRTTGWLIINNAL